MAVNLCTNIKVIGEKLYWGGTLNDLKEFVSNELKLSGGWTSPGGEVKLFTSDTANVSSKWHSKTTKSITLFGDSIETNGLCKLLSICVKKSPRIWLTMLLNGKASMVSNSKCWNSLKT
jgi:hypothetical protein